MSIQDNEFMSKKKINRLYEYAKPFYKAYCNIVGQRYVLPDFLIIGAKKSGTTSLYRYLIQHPSIKSATTKEISFFDRYFQKGTNWYRMNFPMKKIWMKKNSRTELTGEATPTYIYHPHAPKRVYDLLPNVKIIVLLRNPVDRTYSQYNMEANNHTNETLSFEEAIEQEPSRLEGEFEKMQKDGNYFSYNYYTFSYLASSIYADQLERWFKYFPREQFLIINENELEKDAQEVYHKTLKFLKLPKFELKEYQAIGKRKYEKINPETRKKLVEFFKPHNERLYKLLGTNFHWDE